MVNQKSNLKSQSHNSKIKNEFLERCYRFSIAIIKLTRDLPEKRVYWTLSDQLVRSATSIGANIIEGKSARSKVENRFDLLSVFLRFDFSDLRYHRRVFRYCL